MESIEQVKKYVKELCDEDGNIEGAEVLYDDELKGLEEIKEGIKSKDWMLYLSDKSGKIVLDTKTNFLESMSEHFRNDDEVSIEDVKNAEVDINNTARVFADILNLGKGTGQAKRCKETLISSMAGIPTLQGMRKDHKPNVDGDKDKGPPLRPLCGANKSLNAPLGGLISTLLKGVCDELSAKTGTEILSTEELCREAEDLNNKIAKEMVEVGVDDDLDNEGNEQLGQNTRKQPGRRCKRTSQRPDMVLREQVSRRAKPEIQRVKDRVIGSMDAKALYPSIIKELASKAAVESIRDSDLKLTNINVKRLGRFVALRVSREEIAEAGLEDVVPVPKTKTTFNSFTNPRGRSRTTDGDNQFVESKSKPSESEVKHLLGLAVGVAIEECMSKHFYTIGGKVYRQGRGGSIGSALTGETARMFMITWDRKFLTRITELGITYDLYKRYVDDITMVLNTINDGWMYDVISNTMIYEEPTAVSAESGEQRTFRILQEIANSICPQIQMTVDVPGTHRNMKLPVLDLNFWMKTGDDGLQTVCHTFYKKAVSSQYTILKRSAMSMSVKRTTHFQEAMRRLKNCDKNQTWLERATHLTEWCNMLRISGYNEQYRFNILTGAIDRYTEICNMESEGRIDNLYRNRIQVVRDCAARGGKSAASTWFMRGNVSCTLTTASTPDSVLRDRLQKSLSGLTTVDGARTKVVEMGGTPITAGLKQADPFKVPGCMFRDTECIVDPKTSCGTMSVCYQLLCSCGDITTVSDSDSSVNTEGNAQVPDTREPSEHTRASMVAGRRRGSQATRTRQMRENRQEGRKKEGKISNHRKNYIGISGRSLHVRQLEHMDAMRRGDMSYALARHMAEAHSSDTVPPTFTMKLLSRHNNNLEKAVTEGIVIAKQDKVFLLNKKNEWGQNRGLIRLTAGRI
jgi:hypothetical protein